MNLPNYLSGLEVLVPVLAFLFVSLQKWKAGMSAAWRDEAEAQRIRAERLAQQVEELRTEIQALRRENAELRSMLKLDGLDHD